MLNPRTSLAPQWPESEPNIWDNIAPCSGIARYIDHKSVSSTSSRSKAQSRAPSPTSALGFKGPCLCKMQACSSCAGSHEVEAIDSPKAGLSKAITLQPAVSAKACMTLRQAKTPAPKPCTSTMAVSSGHVACTDHDTIPDDEQQCPAVICYIATSATTKTCSLWQLTKHCRAVFACRKSGFRPCRMQASGIYCGGVPGLPGM